MGDWKTTLLLAPFIVQLVINLIFYGFPAIMFSGIVPRSLYPKIAWSLPVLIVIYFLLGMAALYYMGISPRPKRGRLLGSAYFALGALGSAWVILQTLAGMETPLLAIASASGLPHPSLESSPSGCWRRRFPRPLPPR
ncbi:hypothetical protein [Thermococcus thioreducens]|uniref:Uncharacterized protein n=1 Tax=Thermococcus thioreducens TaxID=277988 RepID=A0A0Q2S2X6_9EURY|nr:hypothetical protein [Thermococcus thioreducens]KQH81899.1 hypothetical protein AMR53_09160 [Thermococcus thioreducens]